MNLWYQSSLTEDWTGKKVKSKKKRTCNPGTQTGIHGLHGDTAIQSLGPFKTSKYDYSSCPPYVIECSRCMEHKAGKRLFNPEQRQFL